VVDVGVVHRLAVRLGQHRRRGQFDHLEGAALGVGRGFQQGDVLLAHLVVRVRGVRLRVHDDHTRLHEGGDDVDVAASAELAVVAGQAARHPDDLLHAQEALELPLDIFLGPLRVAARVQLHGLGDQHRAFAVHVDAAALVDHP
jgi:hypothetical protein